MIDFIEIRAFENEAEAASVVQLLKNQQVRCFLKDEHIRADPSLRPAIGGRKLMVHHSQVEKAWDLMERAEQEYLSKIPCPICHSHTLKVISITRNHSCKLSALASMVLKGQSIEIAFVYKCGRCGFDFKDLPSRY